MEVRVITPSDPLELISLQEAKDYLKVDYDNEDDLITSLIRASFNTAERYINSSILEKTIEVSAQWEYLSTPYGPVKEYISLTYPDDLGELVSYPYYNYVGSVIFNTETYGLVKNRVFTLTYTAGLHEVPEDIKIAILKNVYDLYETRGNKVVAAQGVNVGVTDLSITAKNLLNPYRRLFI